MSLIKKMRKQSAYYWQRTGTDVEGKAIFDRPVLIKCRWSESNEEYLDHLGERRISTARVYVDRDVPVGSLLGSTGVFDYIMMPEEHSFDIPLGAVEYKVIFPTAFVNAPAISIQLNVPSEEYGVPCAPLLGTITKEGFTIIFATAVPADGYSVTVRCFNGFSVSIPEGVVEQYVNFGQHFLVPPTFLTQIAIPYGADIVEQESIDANDVTGDLFKIKYKAQIPSDGYKLMVQILEGTSDSENPAIVDPMSLKGVFEVRQFSNTPNLRASEYLKTCTL